MASAGGFWRLGCSAVWLFVLLSRTMIQAQDGSKCSDCHLVGNTRLIKIPGCVEFLFTSNGCRGCCESLAFPTSPEALVLNPRQLITSVSQCCDMDETEDIITRVQCINGIKEYTLKSAKSCFCSQCKKV